MSNLNFLQVNQNFKSYYRTLLDANYYFRNRPELQGTNQLIAEMILNFIGTNGTTFQEMNPEEYERDYRIFEDDFLNIIENSVQNHIDFQTFSMLIDEIIGIAQLRASTRQKLKRNNQERLLESLGMVVIPNDQESSSEIYGTIVDEDEREEDAPFMLEGPNAEEANEAEFEYEEEFGQP